MNRITYIFLCSTMLLPPVIFATGIDDPCGVKLQMSQKIAWGEIQRSRAVETLVATNIVARAAQGDYEAGRSITLLPGFTAEQGSTFTAQIKSCSCDQVELEGNQLKLTAYPNPFVESTIIRYQLTEASPVNLTLVDEQGQTVAVLVSEANQEAGLHEYKYRNRSLQESVYLYSLRTKHGVITKRLVKAH